MQKIKLIIAYDGTSYLGWQKTKMGPSIEETVEKILSQILQEKISLDAASRTDAGVHAEGQVVCFTTEKTPDLTKLSSSLSSLLPTDISLVSASFVPLNFHPTLDNRGKEYHYRLCFSKSLAPFLHRFSWIYSYPLSLEKMKTAASHFIGQHDFTAFCNSRYDLPENRIRTIDSIAFYPENETLLIAISGKDFLYKMVRNIVGTLVYIGSDKLPEESLPMLLEKKDRTLIGMTAPASGLSLKRVFYCDNQENL